MTITPKNNRLSDNPLCNTYNIWEVDNSETTGYWHILDIDDLKNQAL